MLPSSVTDKNLAPMDSAGDTHGPFYGASELSAVHFVILLLPLVTCTMH